MTEVRSDAPKPILKIIFGQEALQMFPILNGENSNELYLYILKTNANLYLIMLMNI